MQSVCRNCSATLDSLTQKLFCSKRCAAIVNNRVPKRKRLVRLCEHCGASVQSRSAKYCSNTCVQQVRLLAGQIKRLAEGKVLKYKRPDGYFELYLPDRTRVYEHRYLVEQLLGRKLESHEHVHHKDGDRGNNSLSNLEVLTASEHAKHHQRLEHFGKVGRTFETLKCSSCQELFEREVRQVRHKRSKGQERFFCSTVCAGKAANAA